MMRSRLWILFLLGSSVVAQQPFDLLIVHGTVVDGSGTPGIRADVGIRDGHIAAIGDLHSSTARRTVEAAGLVVAPGFIDMHNHSDDSLLAEPRCESMVRQGVTTMILGEGNSQGPARPGVHPWTTLGGYFDTVEKHG